MTDSGVCIAANKADLEDEYDFQEEDVKEMADHIGCGYVLTSAWQNTGIDVGTVDAGSVQDVGGEAARREENRSPNCSGCEE